MNYIKRVNPLHVIVIVFGTAALILFLCYVLGLYARLQSTTCDLTWGDFSTFYQYTHNFYNGRPYQSSLVQHALGPQPNAYIHLLSFHVNIIPYLFHFLYDFYPNMYVYFLFHTLMPYSGTAFFSWQILKHLSPGTVRLNFTLVFSLLAASTFFVTMQYKTQPVFWSPPFILGAYYFVCREQKLPFALVVVVLCLIQEDLAAFSVGFAVYLFLFEKKPRFFPWFAFLFSACYFMLAVLVLQPAARYEVNEYLKSTGQFSADSTILQRMKHFTEVFNGRHIRTFFLEYFLPIYGFLCGLAPLLYLRHRRCGFTPASWNAEYGRYFALVFIAPAAQWAAMVLNLFSGPHDTVPILSSIYLVCIVIASKIEYNAALKYSRRDYALILALLGMFLLGNLYGMKNQVRDGMSWLIGKDRSAVDVQAHSNRLVIAIAETIPKDSSLVFWTNRTVEGFLVNRCDIWRFPAFFDLADYLLIQKDATGTFFTFDPETWGDMRAALAKGTYHSTGERVEITSKHLAVLVRHLVSERKSHLVEIDDDHALLLRRKEKHSFNMPSASVGFYFLKYTLARIKKGPVK